MRRALALTALMFGVASVPAPSNAASPRLVVFADRDDDDANGVPDGEQPKVPSAPELLVLPTAGGRTLTVRGASVRVLADGAPLPASGIAPPGTRRLALQGLRAGSATLEIGGSKQDVSVLELFALDGSGRSVDLARSHASIQRTPPERLPDDPLGKSSDPDALRFVVAGPADDLPPTLTIFSLGERGGRVDSLSDVPLFGVPCPEGVAKGLTCGSTHPIRAVPDDIDRNHPLVASRSIKAELGGAIGVLSPRGDKGQMIRVAGPRASAVGPIDRYRVRLRFVVLRVTPKGPPSVGGDDAGALAIARAEVTKANALWASCGVSFGHPKDLDVVVADPPRPHLVALGCDHGLPASGGLVRVRVDGRDVTAKVERGMRPAAAARVVASAIRAAGFVAVVSENQTIAAGAFGSADVLVHRAGGVPALVEPQAGAPLSTDATMTTCIGRVDLEDGLQHFGDVDAIAGTLEERALIKAFEDGDPTTIEVFLVPSFAAGGRLGESFIHADGGSIRNVLIEDRAAVRADRASYALAHELGHILLDEPGHPDDFGIDTPTRLMDADAANPSAYGPRRIPVDECVRAIRQAGPKAPVRLLTPWPLGPLDASLRKP